LTASKFGVQSGVLKSCSGVEFFRYKYRQGRLLLFYYTAMLSIRHKSWKERNHEDAQTCMPSKNTLAVRKASVCGIRRFGILPRKAKDSCLNLRSSVFPSIVKYIFCTWTFEFAPKSIVLVPL